MTHRSTMSLRTDAPAASEPWRRALYCLPLLLLANTLTGLAVLPLLTDHTDLPLVLAASHMLGTSAWLGWQARRFGHAPRWLDLLMVAGIPLCLVWGGYAFGAGFDMLADDVGHAPQIATMAALASLGLALIHHDSTRRLARQRHRASEAERISLETRLRMRAGIDPEVLSTTLHNIDALIGHAPGDARSLLTSLSSYLRASLPSAMGHANTLRKELSLLGACLRVRTADLRGGPRVQVLCAEDCETLQLPPRLLHGLVEGALGGQPPRGGEGTILLGARRDDSALEILVCHSHDEAQTDAGTDDEAGLAPLNAQLAGLFGDEASVQRTGETEHGPGLVMRIPVRHLAEEAA